MHTGDLATMDDEGYVRIVGRIKDMVIRGGENVYPREIEEFLYTHPEIADVQVIGVPDERYGEELMAWVVTRPGASLTDEDVREFCRGQIAHYKIPRYVKFVDVVPDDGHRQGPEVQDARDRDRGARSRRGGGGRHGVASRSAPLSVLLGHPRRVPVVEHQRVSVGIVEERHAAHAGVEDLAVELDAPLLERAPSRLDVVDVQRDRVPVDGGGRSPPPRR